MTKFCKNCGAYIEETALFCSDCGRPNHQIGTRYCPNCGNGILENEYFCRNCGAKIKNPKNESFLEKYKNPIIIVVVLLVIAVIGVGAVTMLDSGESQNIQVDDFSFGIPGDYELNEDLSGDESEGNVKYISSFWENSGDYIQIDVTYSTDGSVDVNNVAKELGGNKTNMMGYDGYYSELSDAYSFSFVRDGKLITIFCSNSDLFDEIEIF